jgi:chromosome partitioning protein
LPDNHVTPAGTGRVRATQITAVSNQKGGVGKTTTAVNLATAIAAIGHPVLLIDLDPQGNASTGFGIPRADRGEGSYQLLAREHLRIDAPMPTAIPRLFVLPAGIELAGAEVELVTTQRREFRLRRALAAWRADGRFRHILIDCPPSLGLLTLNALVAADEVLIPLQCEFYALEGVSGLMQTVETVRRRFNQSLRLHGILLTMVDSRNSMSEQITKDVRDFFGEWVYNTIIPRNVRVSEAPSHGKPVLTYDVRSTGAQAYVRLAGEFLKRRASGLASEQA